MGVKVRLHPFLNDGKEGVFEVNGKTVGECLNELVKTNPVFKERFFERNGKLRNYIEVLVNAKTTFPQELTYPVKDGDEIDLIVFLAGG
jgi:molybdopterin converting factor small subunit